MIKTNIESLTKYRKKLHQHAEIAHHEKETSELIISFLQKLGPNQIIDNIGGHGIIAVFEGNRKGKRLLFRAELDGLPIPESNTFNYKSKNKEWGHKCGHDGHMAILCGLAECLSDGDFPGTIFLLFQPAEETGEGAQKMIQEFDFNQLKIDYAFALHNLPAFPKGQILLKQGVFAAASTGVIIHLTGKPSHASHPENGINPTLTAMQINQLLFELPQMHTALNDVALITPVGTHIGQKAFGTSASKGSVYATIRTQQNKSLEKLKELLSERVKALAKAAQLKCEIEFVEEFQAVVNDPKAYQIVEQASHKMDHQTVHETFPWSEDFGQFSSIFPTCFLGLGAGENQAQLHNEDYDFPDDILKEGIQIFKNIVLISNNE